MGVDVVLSQPPTTPDVAGDLLTGDSSPRRGRPLLRLVLWPLLLICAAVALAYELRTSALQAWLLPRYTARIHYEVADGPSPSIAFPRSGPFDDRLGYSRLREFQSRLEARGFEEDVRVRLAARDLVPADDLRDPPGQRPETYVPSST